ncbi:MAG: hypothetical protein U0790_00290 [Isosphaeraceae bacterium]
MIERHRYKVRLVCDRCKAASTPWTEPFKVLSIGGSDEAIVRRLAMEIGWFRAKLPGEEIVGDWCPECAADHPMAIAVRPRKPSPAKGAPCD